MGFRFRKSFKIAPGVRINLSKSGVSTSVGRRGATLNFSSKGTRATVGIPGSGLSASEMLTRSNRASEQNEMQEPGVEPDQPIGALTNAVVVVFKVAAFFFALYVVIRLFA
jgi:uncharacterized protein DUF4236